MLATVPMKNLPRKGDTVCISSPLRAVGATGRPPGTPDPAGAIADLAEAMMGPAEAMAGPAGAIAGPAHA